VAAAALVLAIGVLFARRLSGSISGLAEAASRIATGDYNLRVPEPRSQDEVRELTQAFNAMAASLKDREERLSQTNLDLERTNEKLQRLNANYMDMLGFISHELKNTLGVIYTSALTLEKGLAGPLSEPQATLVKGISRSIQSAVSMTRNYLDLARIEKAELSTEAKTLEMAEDVIRPVVEEFSPAALERGMVLERDFRGPVWILGDRALLRVVLRNLLSNAIQYGRRGGVIRIGAWQENGIAYLEVWNQGDGLAPDQMERLFEKFLRFHREGEAERKGTGLGLFISREIVRKHGGEIGVRSQQGEWISFLVSLPAQETKDDAVAPSSSR